MLTAYIFLALTVFHSVTSEFPDYIKKCNKNDPKPKLNECISKNGNMVLTPLLQGDPNLGIKSAIPFKIPDMKLKVTDNLNYEIDNIFSRFAKNGAKLTNANIDFQKKIFELNFFVNTLVWNFNFLATGIILNGKIKERGSMELIFNELQFNYTGNFETKKINGIDCMQMVAATASTLSQNFNMNIKEQRSVDEQISAQQKAVFLQVSKKIVLPIREEMKVIGANFVDSYLNRILQEVPENEVFLT